MDKLLVGLAMLLLALSATCVAWAFYQWKLGQEARGLFWVGLGLLNAGLAHRLTAGGART